MERRGAGGVQMLLPSLRLPLLSTSCLWGKSLCAMRGVIFLASKLSNFSLNLFKIC
ncbi:hypothetical protein M758_11G061000 [Ceratodon purpureus]|uniref:Uncharacterized protein n=1 Tax=Ceratodon purpureus TaxID=3225 RepID=A0A8T0GBR0_CERPU|nr:hypothetical protein KC19_11G062800 [Ceratodon purpureus]KAG0600795.1 hypothetical protein M758_11G061000 [Ceratodon purpureus]